MGPNESRNQLCSPRIKRRGGFSKVWKVLLKKNRKLFAMKEMAKVKIIERKSEKSIRTERDFLSKLHHPFIVNMIYAFQDYENLYLVMDLLMGGDLRYHICRNESFTEEQAKFFIACLLLGLEYIHSNNIIHRDIKPENLVSDLNGYIRLTDFGVAKIVQKNNSNETSGTPGYMSPEVLCAQNHSFPVDFFAIGVMGYEFMFGERPYNGKTRKDIKQAVLSKQVLIGSEELPEGWSRDSAYFINGLLQRKPQKRLGYASGVAELKNHRWFRNFNWTDLMNKTMPSPFLPKSSGNYDKKYCEVIDQPDTETLELYQQIMQRDDFVSLFNSYTYINTEEKNLMIKQYKEKTLANNKLTLGTNETLSPRGKVIHQIEIETMENKSKITLSKNKSLLFKNKKGPLKTPIFLNRNNSNFGDARPTITRSNWRNNEGEYLPNTDSHSQPKILFRDKDKDKGIKTLKIFKRLEGSHSCKIINSQLPVINLNQANNIIIQYPMVNNNNNNKINNGNGENESEGEVNENHTLESKQGFKTTKRRKNRLMIPISIDSNINNVKNFPIKFKTLHKTQSGKLDLIQSNQ